MIKTTVTETIEKYDKDGNLIEKTTKTETTEDDETRYPVYPNITPASPNPNTTPWWRQPWCTTTCTNGENVTLL